MPEEVRQTASLLERRWTISVLYASMAGANRFNEFLQAVEGVPPQTLAERLRQLEQAGVLERRVIPSSPPVVEYRLTPDGRLLTPVVEAVSRWRVP